MAVARASSCTCVRASGSTTFSPRSFSFSGVFEDKTRSRFHHSRTTTSSALTVDMAELQMFVSYLERLQAQDTPTNTTRPSIHYERTPGSQIDRKKIGSMPFIRQSVSGPYPCIYPVLSTNKPGVRLQSLLSQLSKLDPSLETRVLKCFTLFSKLPVELRVKIWYVTSSPWKTSDLEA